MSRFFIRIALVVALAVAIGAIVAAFWFLGPADASTWATVAAALAVVTSVISSWTSQISLELQQDAQKPYPYPTIDVESRYNLIQLRVTNYGGSTAHDISLKWEKPITNSKGAIIRFIKEDGTSEIPILLPNESVSTLIDGSMQLFQKHHDMIYKGLIHFKDASGKNHKHPFQVSVEKYRGTLTFGTEEPRTHHELQKIPQEIQRLTAELRAIRASLPTNFTSDDQQIEEEDEELSSTNQETTGVVDIDKTRSEEKSATSTTVLEPKVSNITDATTNEIRPQE